MSQQTGDRYRRPSKERWAETNIMGYIIAATGSDQVIERPFEKREEFMRLASQLGWSTNEARRTLKYWASHLAHYTSEEK